MIEENKIPEEDISLEAIPANEESHMYETESFDDDYESSGLLTEEKYEVPESADAFVNTSEGKIVNKEDLTHFDMIKAIAKENGTELKEPARNCDHCYERGYEGIDVQTKMPIPCRCLFRGRNAEADEAYDSSKMNKKISRTQKRKMSHSLKKYFKIQRKVMKKRLDDGKPFTSEDDKEENKPSNQLINKVLKEYLKQKSLKNTSIAMKMTLTETKKIIKENKNKLEKIQSKVIKEKHE